MNKVNVEFNNDADAKQYVEECLADMQLALVEHSDMNMI